MTHQYSPRKKPRAHPTFIPTIFSSPPCLNKTTHVTTPRRCTSFLPPSTAKFSSNFTKPTISITRISTLTKTVHFKNSKVIIARSEQISENLTDVSESVIRAVEKLSRQPRQTVADIAAAAGISITKATDEAVKLAALTNASIDVSDSGDIAYRFPSGIRNALRSRSLRASLAMTWRRIAPAVYTASRVAFGALLIISIVVTFVAIAALSAAGSSRDDDRRSSRSSFGFGGPRVFFGPDIFNVMFYSQRYDYNNRNRERTSNEMSFLEAVYSFVFGDGNPNVDFDDRRWRSVANVIRLNRGAVTADQLAPFLDPPLDWNTKSRGDSNLVDENFILPALTQFQGHPEVTEDGDIIYVFPSFMTTGSAARSVEVVGTKSSSLFSPMLEEEEKLTRAPPSQRAMVVTLGIVNVLGVLVLGAKLGTAIPVTRDAAQFISFVKGIYPALCAYATSFVVAPLFRWFTMKKINMQIKERNLARTQSSRAMAARNEDVRRKLNAAERFVVKGGNVSNDDVVYSSDRDVMDQIKAQDDLKDDFDRRLNR